MNRLVNAVLAATVATVLISCDQAPEEAEPAPDPDTSRDQPTASNPLLNRYLTPFGAPPFHELNADHFLPALESAIEDHHTAIEEIVNEPAEPDFENTVAALERSSAELSRIARTFFGLISVSPNPDFQTVAPEFSARLSARNDAVLFNEALHERIEHVAENMEKFDLDEEQERLVELTRARFARAGAGLDSSDQERLETLNSNLAELHRTLAQALREATHDHELLIEDDARLNDLPESLVNLAARSARDRGHDQGWAFTLHTHSFYPFLRHFPGRESRREHYQAWSQRVEHRGNQQPPAELMHRIALLRAERAELLGYDSHIDYLLADSTLGSRQQLREMLDRITEAAHERAENDLAQLQELAGADGLEGELRPWDWWYYRERLREQELDLSDAEVRNWFSLEQVRDGAFALANRLWGLTFRLRSDLPNWSPDVTSYEVRDAMGESLGVLYLDLVHRPEKQGGAWSSSFRAQHHSDGERVAPIVANIANFPPAAAGMPSMLSPEETRTLFHEFGHALHELFSDVRYASLAGSAVPGDFVEFPALLTERWALEPEVVRMYAYHHETGNLIDDETVQALQHESRLVSGLETLQYIAAIELDLALHGVGEDEVPELEEAEAAVAERLDLPEMLSPRHYGQGLAALFSAPREGGDYRSLWSEIMAADAFAAFEESTIMDREIIDRLRDEILRHGNARDPMESWQAFRGREPDIQYFLEARGLTD